jgi:hypothetical protein
MASTCLAFLSRTVSGEISWSPSFPPSVYIKRFFQQPDDCRFALLLNLHYGRDAGMVGEFGRGLAAQEEEVDLLAQIDASYLGRNFPRKHVAVCRSCKWNLRCHAYQEYWQPALPFACKKG